MHPLTKMKKGLFDNRGYGSIVKTIGGNKVLFVPYSSNTGFVEFCEYIRFFIPKKYIGFPTKIAGNHCLIVSRDV